MAKGKTKKVEEVQEEVQTEKVEEVQEDEAAETYARQTPFGVEVWDPKEKRTTMRRG